MVIILLNGQYPTRLHSVAKWNDASKKVACCKLLCLKRRCGGGLIPVFGGAPQKYGTVPSSL